MSGTIAPTRDTATVFTLGAPQQEADDKSYSPPGFLSRSIGRISFDEAQIAKDVQTILQFEFNTAYSDYARGNPGWQNCVLWNQSGLHTDTTFGLYDGAPQITVLGRQLPYLNDILTHTFNMDYLRWSRVFLVHRGLIIPHRDYLDLPDTSTRVYIPLQTDTTCMHSEQGYVYHMRKGEIWILDSTEPHAACCFSDTKRLSLCLDFIGDVPVDRLLRIPPRADIPPLFIKRAPFTGNDLDAILGSDVAVVIFDISTAP
jgi:hypothetical protein